MDAARRAMCTDDLFNPLTSTFIQSCGMLVISHIFHIVLKPLGQPGPVAQILAGFVLGPSVLSRLEVFREVFVQQNLSDYNYVISCVFRTIFMFLIGLQTDIPYIRRNLRRVSIIAYGGVTVCMLFGAAVSFLVVHLLRIKDHKFVFGNMMVTIVANSASPVVIRLITELKFATTDVGRLAISSSLVNEMSCMFWYATILSLTSSSLFGEGIGCLLGTAAVAIVHRFLTIWCNNSNPNRKYLRNTHVLTIVSLIIVLSFTIEELGYNSTISCFFIGLMFSREGKTTRTLLRKLTFAVNSFLLPIYFGFCGFWFDIAYLGNLRNFIVVVLVVLVSMGGKIIGTLAACHYLNMPRNEGVILAFILNLKGHDELLLFDVAPQSARMRDDSIRNLVAIIVVLNTIVAGPVVSFILRRDQKYFAHDCTSIEFLDPESEFRMLFCVYGSRHISAKIGLISAFCGSKKAPIFPCLMHLVELPEKRSKTNLMYHELQDGDQYSDEDDYGGNDELEINDAVDAFTADSRVLVHQITVVSSFASMYENVCDRAEDLHVSIVFTTFHKHQRLDGKMESGKEGYRITNHKVLRHAPCSVGIFVDRGQTGFRQPGSQFVQHIATLFFGGPDDREALACSKRIASHPHVNLTVIHFRPSSSSREQYDASNRTDEVLISTTSNQTDNVMDDIFMEDFYNRYAATGKVGYMEKHVDDGVQTVEVLREIGEMYSLFMVGKGARGICPMTTGLSDWEECPELGTVGDLLASSDLNITGSVLVIQRHKHSRNYPNLMDD